MKAYRVEKQLEADGLLQLDALPFRAGERVEVIILASEEGGPSRTVSVRGKVLSYDDPARPVAGNDWNVLP